MDGIIFHQPPNELTYDKFKYVVARIPLCHLTVQVRPECVASIKVGFDYYCRAVTVSKFNILINMEGGK